MHTIYHIMVLWSNAMAFKDIILKDLQTSGFYVHRMFDVGWKKESFLDNYIVFYAHSQKHLPYNLYRDLLMDKIKHCGDGRFFVIVLRDDRPVLENRVTSSGERLVNTRVFDKKVEYRKITGGGYKVHSSDDAWETNKDLTLMFGLNTKDFLCRYGQSDEVEQYERDCVGVGGYRSIEEFFYILNNTANYVVMRNFECLPMEYTVEGHGDIDLLVENKNYVRYLTLARPVFPEDYRVYHEIQIGGNIIPFDLRSVGDNYYDEPWQRMILTKREQTKDLFFIPDPENLYFTLLYHAYVQKWQVRDDYNTKLSDYACRIGLNYTQSMKESINQLDAFMENNRYEYVRPDDKTVVYNQDSLILSRYAFRHGQFVKRNSIEDGNLHFCSIVYEKKNSFVKVGTDWLIKNEIKYLNLLANVIRIPRVLQYEKASIDNYYVMEVTRCAGTDFGHFFADVNHQRKRYIVSFIIATIDMLMTLNKCKISHRDFHPANLIIEERDGKCCVSLIDFGWATEMDKMMDNRPTHLCNRFVSSIQHSDAYSFGCFLLDYWSDLLCVRVVSSILRSVVDDDPLHIINVKLSKAANVAKYMFTLYDSWRLLCRRHQRIGWVKQALLRIMNGAS